jgi:predicted transcriptional regulator
LDERRCGSIPAIAPDVVSEEETEVIELLGRLQASTARVSKAVRWAECGLSRRSESYLQVGKTKLMYKVVTY